MADRFEDERGVIQDLITEPLDAVTRIFTKKGAIRGNHVHNETTQWTYITHGSMLVATRHPENGRVLHGYGTGDLFCDEPGVAHAWKATEDTTVLVFTKGPRSGANYEDDVERLTGENRLLW